MAWRDRTQPQGRLKLTGFFDGKPISGLSKVSSIYGETTIDDIEYSIAGLTIKGAAKITEKGLVSGAVDFATKNLQSIGPLFSTDLDGALSGSVGFRHSNGKQIVETNALVSELTVADTRVSTLRFKGTINDAFNQPVWAGRLDSDSILLEGLAIEHLEAEYQTEGEALGFSVKTTTGSSAAKFSGKLTAENNGFDLKLKEATFSHGELSAYLDQPAHILIIKTVAHIQRARWRVGTGTLSLTGQSDQEINLQLTALPMTLLGGFLPDLELTGELSGRNQY